MLDDDFKEIEDFLKVKGNIQLQTFQKFEAMVDDLIEEKVQGNIAEAIYSLIGVVYNSYEQYDKYSDDVVKDFAISIILIKKITLLLKEQNDDIFVENGKKTYFALIKVLVEALKRDLNKHLNFFLCFSEYINGMISMFNTEN